MYRTLLDLRNSIDSLIEAQGAEAPCAGFIYTPEDVKEATPFYDQENPDVSEDLIDTVLCDVGSSDWIYEQINECVDDSIKDYLKRQASS